MNLNWGHLHIESAPIPEWFANPCPTLETKQSIDASNGTCLTPSDQPQPIVNVASERGIWFDHDRIYRAASHGIGLIPLTNTCLLKEHRLSILRECR